MQPGVSIHRGPKRLDHVQSLGGPKQEGELIACHASLNLTAIRVSRVERPAKVSTDLSFIVCIGNSRHQGTTFARRKVVEPGRPQAWRRAWRDRCRRGARGARTGIGCR